MKRLLRRSMGKLLPEFLKRRYRQKLFGFRHAGEKLPFILAEDRCGWVAVINDNLRLRAIPEVCGDLRYMFQENGSCMEEMVGFFKEAEYSQCLFDVGSHVGLFSLLFCLTGTSKRAVAYEPSPSLVQHAWQLSELNKVTNQIRWEQCAVGKNAGSSTFAMANVGPGAGFATAMTPTGPSEELIVQIVTLDQECKRLAAWPDLLKIDVEGYEWEVLQGAQQLLSSRHPLLLLEVHLDILERNGVPPKQITDYLANLGYRFETPLGARLSASKIYNSAAAVIRIVARG